MKRFTRLTWIGAGLSLLFALALGCGGDGGDESDPETARENEEPIQRFIVADSWDTLATVGGSLQDTVLGDPWRIVADDEAVYLYDHALQRLLAVAHDGEVRWTAGRKGSGPGEFEAVRDLELVGDEILLLDQKNGRITIYGKDGGYRDGVRLDRAGYVHEIVGFPDGRILAFSGDSTVPIAVLDRSGALLERRSMPVPFSERSFMVTQGKATSFAEGERWAYAFVMGPGWWGFEGVRPLSDLRSYLEEVEFPEMKVEEFEGDGARRVSVRLAGDPLFAAHDLVLHDSLAYVRFGGRSDVAGRILDRFRFDDGDYVGSYLLPGRPGAIAIAGSRIAVLYGDPYPALVWLAPRESLDFEPR